LALDIGGKLLFDEILDQFKNLGPSKGEGDETVGEVIVIGLLRLVEERSQNAELGKFGSDMIRIKM
jgi:hypothetical protein